MKFEWYGDSLTRSSKWKWGQIIFPEQMKNIGLTEAARSVVITCACNIDMERYKSIPIVQ